MIDKSGSGRLLRIGFYVFFPGGGIGRYTRELMRAIAESFGVDVEVICSPDYAWKDGDEYKGWAYLSSISHDVPLLRRMRFLKGQFVNPVKAVLHARSRNLDVLHFSHINHLSFPFWKPALTNSGIRLAATAHDVKRQKRIINRRWEEHQLKAFYRFMDVLFVHSNYQAEELADFAGVDVDKIFVVPHGPYSHGPISDSKDQMRRKWNLPLETSIGLLFGQIRDEKNIDRIIEALAVSSTSPHVVVAGSEVGRHRGVNHYRFLARQKGVEAQVRFIPRYISDDEVAELFTASDWIALPYDQSFTSQSGVLNVAAHYNRPVLVGPAPVLQETVEKCEIGLACQDASIPGLAGGIDTIVRRTANGYSYAFETYRQRFSWDENARVTAGVYRQLVNGAAGWI